MSSARTTAAPLGDLAAVLSNITRGSGGTSPVVEVFTGATVVNVPVATENDVRSAAQRAREAQGGWSTWPVERRMEVFRRFHELVLQNQARIADLVQIETGKSRRSAFEEFCDIPMVLSHYLKHGPRVLRTRRVPGAMPLITSAHVVRRPRGVVGILAPWNFPFAIGFCDAIPALMAGNAVLLKPDHRTPLSPAFGLGLLKEAGLPEGVMQIVTAPGAAAGEAVIDNSDFAMFTGSTATGRAVAARAGQRLIGSCLELGGKNPMIVLEDADIDVAVQQLVPGVFRNSGQLCLHIERVLVDKRRYPELREKLLRAVGEMVVAPGYEYGVDMGALANADQVQRVHTHVEGARSAGADVLIGGEPRPDLGPTFYAPTVLENVTRDMAVASEETFGPVVSIAPFDTIDAAITAANDTDYGLSASVWGGNTRRAREVGARIEAGHVNVNDCVAMAYSSKNAPSGGMKASGIGERNGDQGLLKFTDATTIATLKRPLPTPTTRDEDETAVKRTIPALRLMRRLKIR